jgi:hypothetical protein
MKKPYWKSVLILTIFFFPLLLHEAYWLAVDILVWGCRRGPHDYKKIF